MATTDITRRQFLVGCSALSLDARLQSPQGHRAHSAVRCGSHAPTAAPCQYDAVTDFTSSGVTRKVYRAGRGPAVIVLHEINGLTPECLAFGLRVAGEGFTVYVPLFFGEAGRTSMARGLKACAGREFTCADGEATSRAAEWATALCSDVGRSHATVGAVGMCLTGTFPIVMMRSLALRAAVLSQPALPFGPTESARRALAVAPADLEHAQRRSDVPLFGLRFTADRISPSLRFDTLQSAFGQRLQCHQLVSPDPPFCIDESAHSVLVSEYRPTTGHPTRDAFGRAVGFLRTHLVS